MSARPLLYLMVPALLVARNASAQDSFGQPTIDDRAGELPPPAPPEEQPPPPPPRAPRAEQKGLPIALRFDGGYVYRRLFDLHVTGGDVGAALGVQSSQHFAVWWASRLARGDTNNGLDVWTFRTGAEVEGVFDPVRFGIGLGILYLDVARESRNDSLDSYGVDLKAFVRVDAYRSDAFALFLRGSIDSGFNGSGNAYWGPTLGLGIELGVAGERKPEWR